MSRSSRRVYPRALPSVELAVASSATTDPHERARSSSHSRRGSAAERSAGDAMSLPGEPEADRKAIIVSNQRHSIRRPPMHSIFPETNEQSLPLENRSRARPKFTRTASVDELFSDEYMEQLSVFFETCDGDDDGELTANETRLMLGLMGMAEQDMIKIHLQIESSGSNFSLSLESLMKEHRMAIVVCSSNASLPRQDFLLRCKRLKHGFRKIDGDNSFGMTRLELEIAMQKLNQQVTDNELDAIFAVLDRDKDGNVDWSDFVYAAYYNSLAAVTASMPTQFTIDMFADLPNFVRPAGAQQTSPRSTMLIPSIKLSSLRSSRILHQVTKDATGSPRVSFLTRKSSIGSGRKSFSLPGRKSFSASRTGSDNKSTIERLGVEYITRTSMSHLSKAKITTANSRREVSTKDGETSLRRYTSLRVGFSAHVRQRMQLIEAAAICTGSLAGILCGLMSVGLETLLVDDHIAMYYVYLVIINVAVSLLEVHGMYATAVVAAFRLTVCTNLQLYPQDPEREFLTRAIARAALQVGNRKDQLFGIDPMKGSPRLVLLMSFMVYKSKRYALKFLVKLLIKRVLWRAAAKTALNLLVLPINGIMNAWTIRNVMINCRVSIIGPPSIASLLETFFLQDEELSPFQRVDYVRVVGASLVCKHYIHPNIEIMIEHMRHQWLKPELWPVADDCLCFGLTNERCPRHSLDDVDMLLASVSLYATQARGPAERMIRQHRRNLFFVLIVALIIDGSVDWVERRLFVRMCIAGRMQNAWRGVLQLKDDFIAGKGIHTDAVHALIEELPVQSEEQSIQLDDQQMQRVPWKETIMYSLHRVAQFLSW